MTKKSETWTLRLEFEDARWWTERALRFHGGNRSAALRGARRCIMNPPTHHVMETASGKMVAKFRSADDTLTVLVANHPFRASPALVATTEDGVTFAPRADIHPTLSLCWDFIYDAPRYWWTTPAYRETCRAIGIEPDQGRPELSKEADDIAAQLLAHGDLIYKSLQTKLPFDKAWAGLDLAFDLIDAMRDDRFTPWSGAWHAPWVSPYGLARFQAHADAFAAFPAFMAGATRAIGYLRDHKIGPPLFGEQWTEVRFLPSKHGVGHDYRFTVGNKLRHDEGRPDEGAADRAQFSRIGGVAVMPDKSDPLAAPIIERLTAAGVRLIEPGEETDYMATEGTRWLAWHERPKPDWFAILNLFRHRGTVGLRPFAMNG